MYDFSFALQTMIFSMNSTISAQQELQLYLDEVWEMTLVDFVTGATDYLPMVVKDFLNDITQVEESSRRRL